MLNINKVIGIDGIFLKVLKIGVNELFVLLIILFNFCINKNVWFSEWKYGYWVLVYKKDDRNVKENYWFIIFLLCVSKVFEKLVGV